MAGTITESRGRPVRFPRLPVAPLVAAIRRTVVERDATLGGVLEAANVHPKQFDLWAAGGRSLCMFAVADRVCCRLDLDWRTVWPDDERARRAFEGDE